jgi:hypothetical protein
MKLTHIKEIEIKHASIDISVDLKQETSTIRLSYSCPECAGHGCRYRENKCNGGSIIEELNPAKINSQLDKESANKLRSIIQNLYASMVD